MSNALTPEQQRAMVAAYTIPLPEPAFGFLVVSEETGQWIESRAGEAAFDADNLHAHAAAVTAAKDARIKVLEDALSKIDAIRNDIIGRQKIGWSSHVYPMVAALDEAGYPGMEYEAARAALGDNTPTPQPPSPSPRS